MTVRRIQLNETEIALLVDCLRENAETRLYIVDAQSALEENGREARACYALIERLTGKHEAYLEVERMERTFERAFGGAK